MGPFKAKYALAQNDWMMASPEGKKNGILDVTGINCLCTSTFVHHEEYLGWV
jgi:hypothetical protein